MRERFERVAKEKNWINRLYGVEYNTNGVYLDYYLQLRWEGWQASVRQEYLDRTEVV